MRGRCRGVCLWVTEDRAQSPNGWPVKAPPESTESILTHRLSPRARATWPEPTGISVRFRANSAYVDARYPDGTVSKLRRRRYGG